MSKIPTAEKFLYSSSSLHDMWDNTRGRGEWDHKAIARSHIEFAKLHVEAALKQASEKVDWREEPTMQGIKIRLKKSSILNAYPLAQIK